MKYTSILLVGLILAGWLFFSVHQFRTAIKEHCWKRLVGILAASFTAIGALGFMGSGLVALGAFNWLPTSFEWPIGYSDGVVSTEDHYYVVPHTPTGRIQIYTANWKFLRGWNVDAGGGTFKLYVTDKNHIHIITARMQMHYVYQLDGKLVSSETYSATGKNYSSFPRETEAYFVPTPALLWIFSSPLYSWLAAAIGLALFIAKDKLSKTKTRTS
jgi:hypothetical protein